MTNQSKALNQSLLNGRLIWNEDKGFGIETTAPIDYDESYFNRYIELDKTDTAAKLTRARIDLVERHSSEKPLDIGIGGGRFCKEIGGHGYDINPLAVEWLKKENRYIDPYRKPVFSMTFWDSLEHIEAPSALLKMCRGFVFCSIPIFKDREHCLSSKHFKPGEHIWYFTHEGFISWMDHNGFKLQEFNNMETLCGREGINSYAFKRT